MNKHTHKINGRWRSRFIEFVDSLSNPWIAYLLAPLVFYAPPILLFLYFTEDNVKNILDVVLTPGAESFLTDNRFWIFVGSCLLLAIYHTLPKLVQSVSKASDNLTTEDALTLLESLASIVRFKSDRFGSEYDELQKAANLDDKNEVFRSITKPDQQMFFIVNAIWAFLDRITSDIEFQVRLIEVEGNSPLSWYTFAPPASPPQEDIKIFDDPSSTIKNCIQKKKIIVVSDIVKEASKTVGQRYLMTESDDKGSIICYPVYHSPTKSYPYILSIKADKPNYFDEKRKGYYRWLLDQYVMRILMEHSLRLLKGGQ